MGRTAPLSSARLKAPMGPPACRLQISPSPRPPKPPPSAAPAGLFAPPGETLRSWAWANRGSGVCALAASSWKSSVPGSVGAPPPAGGQRTCSHDLRGTVSLAAGSIGNQRGLARTCPEVGPSAETLTSGSELPLHSEGKAHPGSHRGLLPNPQGQGDGAQRARARQALPPHPRLLS